ncbi:MAG: hypothetical protein IPG45_23745 [Deltaproteobacteria bacterium]|nr:hypothetical protein [Deltaproteobacteria bacterium]
MTTERRTFTGLGLLLFLGLACTTGRSGLRGGLSAEVVKTLPAEVAQAYDLFAIRCSRCHTLSRPLSAGIDDFEHWEHYVGRMRKMPGSGISPADGEKILVFLKYYTEHQKDLPAGPGGEQTSTSSTGGAR